MSNSIRERAGLRGEFWTKFLLHLLHVFPAWFCVAMVRPLAVVFYVVAARQRRSIIANIRALRPELRNASLWWAGHEVFVQFALTYMDRLWNLHLDQPFRWETRDCEALEEQLAKPTGVLLFTTHTGNFDIGATLFAQKFPRPIHMVRAPERTAALQEFRLAELGKVAQDNPRLNIHYSRDEWSLGVELCRLLQSGAVVAVQGDRLFSSDLSLRLQHSDVNLQLPRGPFVLAEISDVPCYPIFLSRIGRCHYRLQSGPPFYEGKPKLRAEGIAKAWLVAVIPFLLQHWDQWFVFEPQATRTIHLAHGE